MKEFKQFKKSMGVKTFKLGSEYQSKIEKWN